MKSVFKKLSSPVAILAGIALIYFEWHRDRGITADNIFWLLIGALIVILAGLNLINFAPPIPPDDDNPLLR